MAQFLGGLGWYQTRCGTVSVTETLPLLDAPL